MEQHYHIQGRKSPKQILGLEQKMNQYFSNKIQEKQIIADILSKPQLEEIIPFSEILNQKRKKCSNEQHHIHNKTSNKTQKIQKKQIKYHTSKSSNSNQHNRDNKSQYSIKKVESCCSCYCWSCSRKNSAQIKKPRTPQIKRQDVNVNYTDKQSKSNQAIKQYSIVNSQSKGVLMHLRPHSTEQRKQHIIHKCCKINNPKLSQAISQYSECVQQYKNKEYLQIQQQLKNQCIMKQFQQFIREQKSKMEVRVDIQKIQEEGKLRKIRVKNYNELSNKQILKYRSSSNKNNIQFQQEQKRNNQKNIEKGKHVTRIEQIEKKQPKQVLDLFKQKKMDKNVMNNGRDHKMESKVQCLKKPFESKAILQTFQNYKSFQLS